MSAYYLTLYYLLTCYCILITCSQGKNSSSLIKNINNKHYRAPGGLRSKDSSSLSVRNVNKDIYIVSKELLSKNLAPGEQKFEDRSSLKNVYKELYIVAKDGASTPRNKLKKKIYFTSEELKSNENSSPSIMNVNKEYYLAPKKLKGEADDATKNPLNLNVPPPTPSKSIVYQSEKRLELMEPGFDLTNEEIVKFKLWPQGMIPYFIDDYSFDKVLRDRLRVNLDVIKQETGLHFLELPKPPEDEKTRWVFFINRRGQSSCPDYNHKQFTNEGVQRVVLGYDCIRASEDLAELVLALAGVAPQHNSPDRDRYISVEKSNILPEKKYLFEKLNNSDWLFHDVNYDFQSAGHYHWHKFTKNGQATIKPKNAKDFSVGEEAGFSFSDIWKIRMLYNYISKTKKIKVPDCQKMFEPGTNFNNFTPNSDNDIEPRIKPDKYLGISEEPLAQPIIDNIQNIANDSDDETKQRADQLNLDDAENNNNNGNNGNVISALDLNIEDDDVQEESVEKDKISTEKIAKHTLLKGKHRDNPIEILSDFNTDENTENNAYKITSPNGRRYIRKNK